MNVCAVIVAAGQGTRLGLSTPKAFIELGGRPLFTYCLGVLAAHPSIGRVVIVGPPERLREMGEIAGATAGAEAKLAVVAGGAERWQSVRNGVAECSAAWEWILVHDAARPFVTRAVVDALLEKARSYLAAVTATPVDDTIRRYRNDRAGETVDRSQLVRIGTPQLFRREDLLRAFAAVAELPSPPTDEAVLMQALGIDVGIAWGDPLNFKVTSPGDLELAQALVARRRAGPR
jgi:2-C-methyl-D-erythritol 4-phosphate cytidylyltransferase